MTNAKQQVDRGLGGAERSPIAQAAARSGFVASGLVQALVGVLAIQVALSQGGRSADQSGALKTLASAPGGAIVVWIVALGSLALALWLIVDGVLARGRDAKDRWKHRASPWGKAVIYAAIGVTALRVVLGAGSSSSGSTKKGSADLLSVPGGVVLLALIGAGVFVAGVVLVVIGVQKRFLKTIRVPAGDAGRGIVTLGRVGYIARGVAIAMVGVLFVVAAFTTDAKAASGLDGALHTFAGLPFGKVLLVVIGLGWIAGGVYAALRARFGRLD
jgi:hypothetical protein